jgi:hypothetical protein
MKILQPTLAALAGVLVMTTFLPTGDAAARERQRAGTWQNSQGGSGTWQRNSSRERGSLTRDTTWQNANGREGSASLNRQRDREAGTWSSERSVTRGNGDSASWNKSGQKTDTGAVVHGEGTNFRGQEVSMQRSITRNDDGSRSVTTSRVNETTGKSLTSDKTVTPTENGWTSSGSYTTGSTAGSLSRTEDGYVRDHSVTNSAGQTASRAVDVTRADGSATRTVTTTGFDGETRSRSTTFTPTPAP